jgi:hypothetical protein
MDGRVKVREESRRVGMKNGKKWEKQVSDEGWKAFLAEIDVFESQSQ